MASLNDILAIPDGANEELVRLRHPEWFPSPEPEPSILPRTLEPPVIPKLSPVSTAPAAQPAAPAATPALQPLAPQVDPNAVKQMTPPNLLNSPQSSLMGFKSREEARGAGQDLSATAGAGPTLPATESGRLQVERDKLIDEQKHPWGTPENHPGVVGKIGHVLSRIGNIAGDVVAPATMSLIPGTDLNRRAQEAGLETRLGAAKKEESEENLQKAEAFAKMHPELAAPGKTPEEMTYADLLRQTNPNTGQPYTHEEALQKIESDKAEAKPDSATQNAQRITANDTKLRNDPASLKPEERDELAQTQRKEGQAKIPEEIRAKIAEPPVPGDKKYVDGYNDPQYHKDLEAWIKTYDAAIADTPQAKATAEQRKFADDMRRQLLQLQKDRVGKGEEKTDLATREKVLTYFKPALDADVRLNLMVESEKKALKDGDQQAMVNLVANHVAMVLGMPRGKVPRVSHEFFNEAIKAAPILQRAEAHFDKEGYLSGIVLTPEQMKFMVDLAKQTREQEWASANSSADYIGVKDRPVSTYKGEAAEGDGEEKTYTQADVDAAVTAHPGTTAAEIEAAFAKKNWKKK